MKRKFKEIALLLVPVATVIGLVLGVRLFNNWREAHQVPRIEACYLRAPTAWEESQGATVGYTARTVVPDDGGPFWVGDIELRNAQGERWASGTPVWNQVAVSSDDRYPNDGVATADIGSADNTSGATMELRGGLKWKRIAGQAANVHAEVSLWPDDAAPTRHIEKARDFTLKNRVLLPPLASLRHANFQLEKVQMNTSDCGKGCGLSHRFEFRFKRYSPISEPSLCANSVALWRLSLNANNRVFVKTFDIEDDWYKPGQITTVVITCHENMPLLRYKPVHLTGPLSIDDGWPQNIRVELPHGLLAKSGTITLPFSAQLAPLPK